MCEISDIYFDQRIQVKSDCCGHIPAYINKNIYRWSENTEKVRHAPYSCLRYELNHYISKEFERACGHFYDAGQLKLCKNFSGLSIKFSNLKEKSCMVTCTLVEAVEQK